MSLRSQVGTYRVHPMALDRKLPKYRTSSVRHQPRGRAAAQLERLKTINFEALFSASPNPYVLLDLSLTIVGMNDAYLQVTMREREDLIGRNMFDAFPSDPDSTSYRQLRGSLEKVVREKAADHLPLIEYAIPLPNGRGFEERYWSATHTPLFNHAGELTFILQHTVDVTELHRLRNLAKSSGTVLRTFRPDRDGYVPPCPGRAGGQPGSERGTAASAGIVRAGAGLHGRPQRAGPCLHHGQCGLSPGGRP